jgi:hypothetical protein
VIVGVDYPSIMFTKKIGIATGLYQAIDKGCNIKKSSMNLKKSRKNLSKATAVAVVIGIATCLFPAIAQAQVIRVFQISGVSPPNDITSVRLDFSVGTSEVPVNNSDVLITSSLVGREDVNSLDSFGEFPGSIRELRVDTNDDNLDLLLTSGTLRTSRLTIDPSTGNFAGLSFGYQAITDNNLPYAAFNNDGLRYDFTFDNRSETLTLFIPSNDSKLINSPFNTSDSPNVISFFGELYDQGGVQGVVSYPNLGIEQRLLVTGAQRVVTVSEPTATASLFGVGALGAVSLLKRNKRLRKSV